MKTCGQCGEPNGDGRTVCIGCGAHLPKVEGYKKTCRRCHAVYNSLVDECPTCHIPLSVLGEALREDGHGGARTSSYIISALLPTVGIIMGLIFIAQRREEEGKACIIIGIIGPLVLGLLLSLMFGLW